MLQEKLEEPISEPPSPRQFADGEDAVGDLASHITSLREEIRRLKQQLAKSEADCKCSNVRVTRTDTALYGYLSRTTSARKYQTISGLRWGSRRGALERWRSPPLFWVINEEFRDRRKAGWASKATPPRPLSSRSGSSTGQWLDIEGYQESFLIVSSVKTGLITARIWNNICETNY